MSLTSDPFATVATELPRDRWGRPLITPPGETEPVPYQRTTTFVGVLEDTYHLAQWQQRMAVYGTALRKDIQLAASAIRDPKDRFQKRTLNQLAKNAIEAASGSAAATTGTALHTFTEEIDKGQPLGFVPEEYLADLEAYRLITAPFQFPLIEGFCVRDDLRVGGSFDRLFTVNDPLTAPDGEQVYAGVWDLKTGGSIESGLFGIPKIAMQMGVYRNSVLYDHTLGSRTPMPEGLSAKWGVVAHLPAGTGTAQLLWVDIEAGWDIAYTVAPLVHAWRKKKADDLSSPFASVTAGAPQEVPIPEQIRRATSYAELVEIHRKNALVWTDGLTAEAAKRKKEIESA